ncbi:hypothetical protein Ahy_B09g099465 isoform B [Arachis hypogaea]|uniref:Uncharacterized protein n=1 Tax=Arachis hypogaea TaxID=3818 RepID=A0A444XUS1_ARAHY|nr:hypothetical protein Ahy_B09g099465 isoform B [Arachis hypogaea]
MTWQQNDGEPGDEFWKLLLLVDLTARKREEGISRSRGWFQNKTLFVSDPSCSSEVRASPNVTTFITSANLLEMIPFCSNLEGVGQGQECEDATPRNVCLTHFFVLITMLLSL